MEERFNKTLLTMLRSFVEEIQDDWDDLLPYVLMAYRSVEHETTCSIPNYLMLGREVASPLDLMYEMSEPVKTVSANRWAWVLRIELRHPILLSGNIVQRSISMKLDRKEVPKFLSQVFYFGLMIRPHRVFFWL